MRRITAVAAVACALSAPAIADDGSGFVINFGGISHHFRNDDIHNDANYGLGLEYRQSAALGYAVGAYHNSLFKTTTYALVRYQPFALGPVRFGAVAGLVNGYNVAHGNFFPAVMPAVSVDIGHLAVMSLVGVPSIGRAMDGVVSLQLGWRL